MKAAPVGSGLLRFLVCVNAYLAAAFARRDFLRAALLGWMIPLAAALSNCASTEDVTVALFADFAFLQRVFRRVFVSRFRCVRFSLWRTHLTAALMLGTRGRIPRRAL